MVVTALEKRFDSQHTAIHGAGPAVAAVASRLAGRCIAGTVVAITTIITIMIMMCATVCVQVLEMTEAPFDDNDPLENAPALLYAERCVAPCACCSLAAVQ